MGKPSFWSQVLAEIRDPDDTFVAVDVLPAHATADPEAWARRLLSPDALPRWIAGPLALGDLVRRGRRRSQFAVRRVQGDEALIALDTRMIDVRIGVGVDEDHALVRVVTALRYKGERSHLLAMPARMLIPLVLRGMIARTRRGLSGVTR